MTRAPVVDLEPVKARVGATTPGEWRLLPSEEVKADPEVVESGCVYVARLGGLGVNGRAVWSLIGPLYPMAAQGPYSDGTFIAHARTDMPALIADLEATRVERDEARALAWSAATEIAELRAALANESVRSFRRYPGCDCPPNAAKGEHCTAKMGRCHGRLALWQAEREAATLRGAK